MKFVRLLIAGLLMVFSATLYAANVSGIKIEEEIQVDGNTFVLNGAGVREKFIFDIYVIALFLPQKQSDAQQLLESPPASRIMMHFVYNKVDKEALDEAWDKGFKDNVSAEKLSTLTARLETLKSMFGDAVKNDLVYLDYFPTKGTRITINDSEKGWIDGEDFYAGLLSVWLGEKPINKKLKNRLLGK